MVTSPSIDTAYRALRQAIVEQALPPGTKLLEEVLAERFGISRTPVRAVLARLNAEGLVDIGGKRSASVARPSLAEARDTFGLRRVLEREAVRLVHDRRDPSIAVELEGMIAAEEAAGRDGDHRVSGRLAGEFHIRLAELSGNGLLSRYLGEVVSRCSLILATHGRPHASDCSIAEHRQIVAGLRAGALAPVQAVMEEHLQAVERRGLPPAAGAEAGGLGDVLSHYARLVGEGSTPAPD